MLSRRLVMAALAPATLGSQTPRRIDMFGNAEAYERFMGRWSRELAPLLVKFAAPPDGGRILDVGSGTGALAFSIVERKPQSQVVGIDPSQEYIAYATAKKVSPDRLGFEAGDAQRLRFSEAEFDGALSLLVFNFIPDPARALHEIVRVTRAGGSVSAAVWDYGAGMRMLRVFWDAAATVDAGAAGRDESHMPLCRAGELEELWKQGGLEQVVGQPLDITMRFTSFADYWDPFLLGQGPAGAYLHALTEGHREAVRGEVKRRLALRTEDAPFSLPSRAWAVRGIVPPR